MTDSRSDRSHRSSRAGRVLVQIVATAALALTPAVSAWADDAAADASEEAVAEVAAPAAGDPMPCGELSQAKYPFLTCVRSEAGHPVLAVEGAGVTGAQLEFTSDYVSGAGGWGTSGIE